jgi:hypothetical protein
LAVWAATADNGTAQVTAKTINIAVEVRRCMIAPA